MEHDKCSSLHSPDVVFTAKFVPELSDPMEKTSNYKIRTPQPANPDTELGPIYSNPSADNPPQTKRMRECPDRFVDLWRFRGKKKTEAPNLHRRDRSPKTEVWLGDIIWAAGRIDTLK